MSEFSLKTGISSILKAYSSASAQREKCKTAAINKVRFEMPKALGITKAIQDVIEHQNYALYNNFVDYINEDTLSDADFLKVITEARTCVYHLKPVFNALVESLLSMDWIIRNEECIEEYTEFMVDLLVAHSKYVNFGIRRILLHWIPNDSDAAHWPKACPDNEQFSKLKLVHNILNRLLDINPMIYDVVLNTMEKLFPYFKKPTHVVAGYLHNVLWLLEYKPSFNNYAIEMIFQKMLLLDVNAPRSEIEDEEDEEEEEDMFEMDDTPAIDSDDELMKHPIAETLDVCMEKLYKFLDKFRPDNSSPNQIDTLTFYKTLMNAFENVILPSHNTHHVQFLVFYYCSFKNVLGEKFLITLWNIVKNPNMSAPIRQASVGYIASFLARSKFSSLVLVQNYLLELCNWAHQYICRSDTIRTNCALKTNIVFFSMCQAVFYVIAFRSRDLTRGKKDIIFLQSLQLSSLVTCNFNPLKVCLPAVATAFAGVTRAYQLAYCHTILERNARRKLATVYANEVATPEEVLETFFPFDPYLLKKSGTRITPLYLQYQASEEEETTHTAATACYNNYNRPGRKRGDSEMCSDDVDDFLLIDKKQKLAELSKSIDKDSQFTYGLSPGFHI